jgi:hypothetical protein
MYINEAIKLAMELDCAIVNKSKEFTLAIKPTNSADCCIVYHPETKIPCLAKWNPCADDLMSNAWEIDLTIERGLPVSVLKWIESVQLDLNMDGNMTYHIMCKKENGAIETIEYSSAYLKTTPLDEIKQDFAMRTQ